MIIFTVYNVVHAFTANSHWLLAVPLLTFLSCVSCVLQAWLQRYGYLPPTDPRMSVLRSAQSMQSAIAAMQRLYGLNVTGALDKNTIEWVTESTSEPMSPSSFTVSTQASHPLPLSAPRELIQKSFNARGMSHDFIRIKCLQIWHGSHGLLKLLAGYYCKPGPVQSLPFFSVPPVGLMPRGLKCSTDIFYFSRSWI